ncbi:hypothetical protein, partial [Paenibacillus paridis]|uniref:hypothetical protein n=1 Tax=Paenibacillus paridis TaxID=2583376 RepID=UPI001EE41DBE
YCFSYASFPLINIVPYCILMTPIQLGGLRETEKIGLENRSILALMLQMGWIWFSFREIDMASFFQNLIEPKQCFAPLAIKTLDSTLTFSFSIAPK